jgi:hypothetical protein
MGTFISDTDLLVNMNGIGISPSTFVPGTSFPGSLFNGALAPGEVASFHITNGEFVEWDASNPDTPDPLGIRGNSNNIIQTGLFTAGGAPYGVPPQEIWASTIIPGALTVSKTLYRVGFSLSPNELFVNMIGQKNWEDAFDVFTAEHVSPSGVHTEGSARTFVGLAADAGVATSGSLASSTGMTLFATDTGQVFHCTNGSADTWIEASQFTGPVEITNSLEVGGNLILGNQTLDDGISDTMNPFIHALRHQSGGDDPLAGIIGQILVDTDSGSQALLTPITNLTEHSSVGFDFTGRGGNSTILFYWVGNLNNASGAGRTTEARTFLDVTTTGVFIELGVPFTAQVNTHASPNTGVGQFTIIGYHNSVTATAHTLEIRAAANGASATTEDRVLLVLDLGPN